MFIVQTSCSPHLAYSESLVRRLALSRKFYGVMLTICVKIYDTRPIDKSFAAQDFLCAVVPLAVRQTEQSKGHHCLGEGRYSEMYRVRFYTLSSSVCEISGQSVIHVASITLFRNLVDPSRSVEHISMSQNQTIAGKLLSIVDFTSDCHI